ncbi:MAG: restriction endonuclease subunit S [Candidatus Gracilibacteria bacterium]|jgi:type I restriction enzyme S subunit
MVKKTIQTNWQTKKLDEVCDLITCGVAARPNYVVNGTPFLSAKNVKNGQVIWNGFNCISESTHKELTKNNKPMVGDILYTRVGSYGEAAVVEDNIEFSIFVSLTLIKVNKNLLNNYFLKYYLNSSYIKSLAKSSISSSGVGNLNVGSVRDFPISFPPIPEQRRIVKILDEAFEKTAKAKENAEKNLQNAKELFESYLHSVFTNSGKDWEEEELGDICEVEYGYTEKAKNNGDYRFVRITDTDENGLLTKENKMYIDSFDGADKYVLNDGDLLMARTGASAGNVLLFEGDEDAVFASYLIRMKFKKEILSKLYWYFSKSKIYWDQVSQLSAGSAQPQFNGGALKQVIFSYPKFFSEQKAIVAHLDALSAETKKLESIYKQKLTNLEELKKSVLKKAFSGQL